jgi:putative transcriptional regulator
MLYCIPMAKKIINRIKAVLAEKNVTSRELAAQLDKTETSVSRWCTNDMQPSLETLLEIAKVLDVDIRELLVKTK